MISNRNDLNMQQGETFQLKVVLQDANSNPVPLTGGWTAIMQVRPEYGSSIVTEQLSTANGEITYDNNTGMLDLQLSASRTANIFVDNTLGGVPPKSIYYYDMIVTSPANVSYNITYGQLFVYSSIS